MHIGDGLGHDRVVISALRLRFDALQSHPRGKGPLRRQIDDLALEHDAVRDRESVGFQALVDDFEPFRNGDVGPSQLAAGVNSDLRGRALLGIAGIGGVETGRQFSEVFPVRGLPDHEHPVHPRGGLLRRLAIGIEPEARPYAVMHDDPLRFHLELGEVGQYGA